MPKRRFPVRFFVLLILGILPLSCGGDDQSSGDEPPSSVSKGVALPPRVAEDATAYEPITETTSLATADGRVLATAIISLRSIIRGFSLGNDSELGVELESEVEMIGPPLEGGYLRMSGQLRPASDLAEPGRSELGCLYVELKDPAATGSLAWIKLAGDGLLLGDSPSPRALPLEVRTGDWHVLPTVRKPLTLGVFAAHSPKEFDAALCLRLNLKEPTLGTALVVNPTESFEGKVILQYLRNDDPSPPEADLTRSGALAIPRLSCASQPVVLSAGQSTVLAWEGSVPMDDVDFSLRTGDAADTTPLGSIMPAGEAQVRYTAPSIVAVEKRVFITASSKTYEILPAICEVSLVPDSRVGIPDDGESRALLGNVYKVDPTIKYLPDFSLLKPVATVMLGNFDIPVRAFEQGFPGVESLYEWFGIEFKGQIWIPESGVYRFKLTADDGAQLLIDDKLVVDNDGLHPVTSRVGKISLKKGWHDVLVKYFQGPRYHIALQLAWRRPGESAFSIVEADAFARPRK